MPAFALPFSSIIDVPTARILARDDAGTGPAEALTNLQLFAILGTGTPSASTYLRGDGAWATVSAGISSLNGLTDATQTFAVGTTGTDVAFVSAAGVHTLNIPNASTTARGLVTTGTQSIAGVKSFTSQEIRLTTDGSSNQRIRVDSTDGTLRLSVGNTDILVLRSTAWSNSAILTNGLTINAGGGLFDGVELYRDARGVLYQYDSNTGVNTPQKYYIANVRSSGTSFERLEIAWASNVCTIEVTKGSAGGTLRGLKIGGASTSLLGFYGATPVDRPDTIADPAGGGTIDAEARTAINTIIDRLQEIGLIA